MSVSPPSINDRAEATPAHRNFHLQVSYSTVGTDPEDALRTFFEAIRQPGSMYVEVYEEGQGDQVVAEFDGDDLNAIAMEAIGDLEADTGPQI